MNWMCEHQDIFTRISIKKDWLELICIKKKHKISDINFMKINLKCYEVNMFFLYYMK